VEVSSAQSASRPKPQRSPPLRWLEPDFLSPRSERLIRIAGKLVGAAGAALFAKASVQYYLHTHSFIGAAFLVEQMWVCGCLPHPTPCPHGDPTARRLAFCFGGTFGGVLFRPVWRAFRIGVLW